MDLCDHRDKDAVPLAVGFDPMEGIPLENEGRVGVMGFCDEIILSAHNKTKGARGIVPTVTYRKALVGDDKSLPGRNLPDIEENRIDIGKLPVETLLEFWMSR